MLLFLRKVLGVCAHDRDCVHKILNRISARNHVEKKTPNGAFFHVFFLAAISLISIRLISFEEFSTRKTPQELTCQFFALRGTFF